MMCHPQRAIALIILGLGLAVTVQASNLDMIGVTLLRAATTNLNGAGIRVAQPEASDPLWEVNPTNVLVMQSLTLFSYIGPDGITNAFPNSVGTESGHANTVAGEFYGTVYGVATNVAHVDNLEATYFYTNYVTPLSSVGDSVINQSYIFGYVTNGTPTIPGDISVSEQQSLDSQYDNYAAKFGQLLVSGIGNGGAVDPPATCYNGIGVGAFRGSSSTGPTLDNGRCKPDLVAPEGETSYATPEVAGAAAILMQAAKRGDGGGDTNSAADLRVVKALLLNGAVKPGDWTNSSVTPLDARYGAGVLNVYNSYAQLAGGKRSWIFSTNVPQNTAHLPVPNSNFIPVLNGWDFNTNSSGNTSDGVEHYFFNVTNAAAGARFLATATLVWNRHQGKTGINNLELFLYNCANSNLVACSTSAVDNVQHLFVPQLAPGRYDLQVWKAAGISGVTIVSGAEPYALAFAFVSPSVAISRAGGTAGVTWPFYPAGFALESSTDLAPANWSTNNLPSLVLTNGQNQVQVPLVKSNQFFRLRLPNF
ncbi:MAG TPA: S8 family serine peptidase [Verrucomicrobiae bacterium]|nr:S8 family serine peptidase [Verrucomicrobiae bacterium]